MALTILIVLGILAAIYGFAMNHHWRFDLTENLRYSLAPQTIKILDHLEVPVKAYAFYKEGDLTRVQAEEVLSLYEYHSKEFSWEFLDPDRFPLKAQEFNVSAYNTVVLEQGDRFEEVSMAEEERITNALLKLTRDRKRVVYFVEGHGEHGLNNAQKDGYSDVKLALEDEYFEVKALILAGEEAVPDDADVVVIGGPSTALLEGEVSALKAYLERGGKLLILADPEKAPGLETFLESYGIQLGDDIIVDRGSRILVGDYLVPVIAQYEMHPITRDFRQRPLLTYLPVARSVQAAAEPPEGIRAEVLALTGRGSWGERDLERLKRGEAQQSTDEDLTGPVPVLAVASIPPEGENKGASIVVFGDSDFVSNGHLDPTRSGNQDLFLNTVNWLAEQEDLISIRARPAASRPVYLGRGKQILIFALVVVGFPVTILTVGLGILWRKRWKK